MCKKNKADSVGLWKTCVTSDCECTGLGTWIGKWQVNVCSHTVPTHESMSKAFATMSFVSQKEFTRWLQEHNNEPSH